MHRYGTLSGSIGGGGSEDQRMRRNARTDPETAPFRPATRMPAIR